MTAEEFIANNLAPIMGLLFLLMTIVKNDTMDLPDRKLFLHIWIFELLELTAYNLELVTAPPPICGYFFPPWDIHCGR